MYECPINIIQHVHHDISEKLDAHIMEIVTSYDIHVDKDELVRALEYDRDQYQKGWEEGREDLLEHLRKGVIEHSLFADVSRALEAYKNGFETE